MSIKQAHSECVTHFLRFAFLLDASPVFGLAGLLVTSPSSSHKVPPSRNSVEEKKESMYAFLPITSITFLGAGGYSYNAPAL